MEANSQAKRLFAEGKTHYDLAEYDPAIASFRQAYALTSAPLCSSTWPRPIV